MFRAEKKLGEHAFIVIYLFTQLILNGATKYLLLIDAKNIYVYQLNCILSLIIINAYFLFSYYADIPFRLFRYYIILSAISVIITSIIISSEDDTSFNSNSYSVTALVIFAQCLLYYCLKLLKPVSENIVRTRSFWFIMGIFIYYGGSFFIFSTYRILSSLNEKYVSLPWKFHNIFLFLMCICFSIAFTCRTSPKT
ncbi:MAG: hypothetical protein QM731_18215 [Chitinophagaceae bacterium]